MLQTTTVASFPRGLGGGGSMSTRRHAWKWIWLGVAIIILAAFLTIGLAMPEIADGQVVRTPSWGVAMLGLAGMVPGVRLIVRTCRQHGIPSRAAGVVLLVFAVLFYFATI